MKFCSATGEERPEHEIRFCGHCGAPLVYHKANTNQHLHEKPYQIKMLIGVEIDCDCCATNIKVEKYGKFFCHYCGRPIENIFPQNKGRVRGVSGG
ncbi:hypothetical protein A2V49_00535 [candidate division WWE3 bacterium RBG_19FT_COMBO_34_6]|uniref:Uncharacterized protein n=1 Tax=candidate division WWE3 bacterium RBG_19FT_COMBO_34_6 TaxID=1802612 RepID=A0A1F4UNG4_UNCKA|nr:MAG: hypothetical protein A2V49_00535 [candidate division WWE3 bacterium RBG_19FT_COMBO_34_6]